MSKTNTLLRQLRAGVYDDTLRFLYALDGTERSVTRGRDRAIGVAELFEQTFASSENAALFSAPGRTEIGGNHTDHQHGCVLCGSVDVDMLACAAPNGTDRVRIVSEGFPPLELSLSHLLPCEEERGTSTALVRGMAAGMQELGCKIAGFDACVCSSVLSGSGLSSSAAYEVLIGNIINYFGGGGLDAVAIAKVGQYAENVYFGKPCGLMDQMASSVGGIVAIDFADPSAPAVEKVNFDFSSCGHALCIIDTVSDHADLTDDYAAITREMGAVAAYFGKPVLREVAEADFRAAISPLRAQCGDRAVLRAMHFFDENHRAEAEAAALKQGDFTAFLELVKASGHSSATMLQNIWSVEEPRKQAVSLALALGAQLLEGRGAIRVHGGGFAGTVQAFVPEDLLPRFRTGMEEMLGAGTCHVMHIRPTGGCVLIP
ncbi:MAG: galactokinase [Oscillospiraceae bacterium]|nr:galactokinase [Oscillospiraceae bacterium]